MYASDRFAAHTPVHQREVRLLGDVFPLAMELAARCHSHLCILKGPGQNQLSPVITNPNRHLILGCAMWRTRTFQKSLCLSTLRVALHMGHQFRASDLLQRHLQRPEAGLPPAQRHLDSDTRQLDEGRSRAAALRPLSNIRRVIRHQLVVPVDHAPDRNDKMSASNGEELPSIGLIQRLEATWTVRFHAPSCSTASRGPDCTLQAQTTARLLQPATSHLNCSSCSQVPVVAIWITFFASDAPTYGSCSRRIERQVQSTP